MGCRCRARSAPLIAALALLSSIAAPAAAQKLAIRNYEASDGVAHGVVINLHQDGKGYLWLATYEGLSRFDGYGFTNYGANDGLGRVVVNDVVTDRAGRLWVALNGLGVARLGEIPAEQTRKFTTYMIDGDPGSPANAVNRLLFDADNRLWCVTDAGLYRARDIDVADGGFERLVSGSVPYFNNAAFADSRGRLWFGVGAQVVQVAGGRVATSWPARDAEPPLAEIPPWKDIVSILEDDRGRILAAEATGIYELVEPQGERAAAWRRWPLAIPPAEGIRAVASARDGGLWIGTAAGLIRYQQDRLRRYTTEHGLSTNRIRGLLRDREDNLWIATEGSGLGKLSDEGVVGYTLPPGAPAPEVYRLAEDREARIYATVGCAPRALVEIGDDRVRAIAGARLARSECFKSHLLRDDRGHTWYHTKAHATQDSAGNWWFHTERGLEFAAGPRVDFATARLIGPADGFPERFYSELYEDAEGKIWVVNGLSGNLYVADARQQPRPVFRFVHGGLTNAEFLLRDRSGTLWIANDRTIWRLSNGRLTALPPGRGLPAIEPRSLFQDRQGRVWIGLRYHGVSMTTEPDAAAPRFVNYGTANGLASDAVWSIAEDHRGRIYLGTGRGLDRLDVETGKVRHLTAADGVRGSVIEHVLEDRRGFIWVASDGGISRLEPRLMDREEHQPPIFISAVRIGDQSWPLPVGGARHVPRIELRSSQNHVAIQFVGLGYRSERRLRYRYQLEGVDPDWSEPTEQREVNFAQLAPGQYRFLVRAVTGRDVESAEPATVEFHILPPVYWRPWFLALAALALSGMAYAAYRYRVARLLEVANMRAHIATDLHDDIGANLTRIAILSELAQRQGAGAAPDRDARLSSIARIARESVAAMSDIVWAINPQRDTLPEVIRKIREHAEQIFEGRGADVTIDLPDDVSPIRLGMDVRRDLYLIFKEAVNNAARHSGGSRASIALTVAGRELSLAVADNGAGFDPAAEHDGHGLASMRRRARRIGARLDVDSAPGAGTTVRLTMTVLPR